MTIEISSPELEQMVQREMLSGHFESADDLIAEALQALRQKTAQVVAESRPRQNLAQFLLNSPFAGSDLELERRQDYGRPTDL